MRELRSGDGKYACVIQQAADGTPALRVAHAGPDGRYYDLCSLRADQLFAALLKAGLLPDAPEEEQGSRNPVHRGLPF